MGESDQLQAAAPGSGPADSGPEPSLWGWGAGLRFCDTRGKPAGTWRRHWPRLTAALSPIATARNEPRSPSVDRWTKMWVTTPHQRASSHKAEGNPVTCGHVDGPAGVMSSEISQTQPERCCASCSHQGERRTAITRGWGWRWGTAERRWHQPQKHSREEDKRELWQQLQCTFQNSWRKGLCISPTQRNDKCLKCRTVSPP